MIEQLLNDGERIVSYTIEAPDGTRRTVTANHDPLPASPPTPFVDRTCGYCRSTFLQRHDEPRRRFCTDDCRRLAMDRPDGPLT